MNNQLHEGYYITSCGKVWSYKSNRFLSTSYNKKGYKRVQLWENGKNKIYLIHRLVAETYIPNPNNLDTVDHIDGNKEHNYISNLQWLDNKDNVRKSLSRKVRCVETGEIFNSHGKAAEFAKVSRPAISRCIEGFSKTSGGYHWEKV